MVPFDLYKLITTIHIYGIYTCIYMFVLLDLLCFDYFKLDCFFSLNSYKIEKVESIQYQDKQP